MLQAEVSARAVRFDEAQRRRCDVSDVLEYLRGISTKLSEICDRLEALEGGAVSALPVAGIRKIQLAVCDEFGVALREIISSRRNSAIVLPRHVAFYLCRELTLRTYAEIGAAFSNRDHSTIQTGSKQIELRMRDDAELRARIDRIRDKIKSEFGK